MQLSSLNGLSGGQHSRVEHSPKRKLVFSFFRKELHNLASAPGVEDVLCSTGKQLKLWAQGAAVRTLSLSRENTAGRGTQLQHDGAVACHTAVWAPGRLRCRVCLVTGTGMTGFPASMSKLSCSNRSVILLLGFDTEKLHTVARTCATSDVERGASNQQALVPVL